MGDAALSTSNADDGSVSAGDDASSLGASTLSFSERTGPGDHPSVTDESFSFGTGGTLLANMAFFNDEPLTS